MTPKQIALVWTLERGLGAAFTRDVEDAWCAAYGVLAAAMQQTTTEESHARNSAAS